MQNLKILFKIYEGLTKWLMDIICGVLILMMVTVFLNVAGRKLFAHPIEGTIEINEYFLFVIPFLGAAYILKENSHVKIDIILRLFSPRAQAIVNGILMIIIGLVFTVYCSNAYHIFYADYISGFYMISSALKLPRWIYGAVMLLGFALLTIQSFINAYKYLAHKKL